MGIPCSCDVAAMSIAARAADNLRAGGVTVRCRCHAAPLRWHTRASCNPQREFVGSGRVCSHQHSPCAPVRCPAGSGVPFTPWPAWHCRPWPGDGGGACGRLWAPRQCPQQHQQLLCLQSSQLEQALAASQWPCTDTCPGSSPRTSTGSCRRARCCPLRTPSAPQHSPCFAQHPGCQGDGDRALSEDMPEVQSRLEHRPGRLTSPEPQPRQDSSSNSSRAGPLLPA